MFNTRGVQLESVKCIKLLYIHIDRNLTFDTHVNEICKKASKQINILSRLAHKLNVSSKSRILECFTLSNFKYCSTVYYSCSLKSARKIELLHKGAIQFVLCDYESDYLHLLVKANRIPMIESRMEDLLINVFKVLQNDLPPLPSNSVTRKQYSYGMRDTNILVLPPFYHFVILVPNCGIIYLQNKVSKNTKRIQNSSKKWNFKCNCGVCFNCRMFQV